MTEPTELDRQNAARRQAISDRFRAQYLDALALAEQVLGQGWEPCGRHSIIENDEADAARKENRQPLAVVVVITARKGDERRHFTVVDGVPRECGPYDEAFAELLSEMHPTKPIFKHQVHWGGFEKGYAPRTAEQLAAAREKPEERAVEKEAQENPLFADVIRAEGAIKQPRRKGTGR